MHLTSWASNPTGSPPPIPFDTIPIVSTDYENRGYDIRAIPAEALRDDLAAIGLVFVTGQGNHYELDGKRVSPTEAAAAIAAVFLDAGAALDNWLESNETVWTLRAYAAERQHDEADRLAATLDFDYYELDLAARSLRDVGRAIRRWPSVRALALAQFKPIIVSRPPCSDDELAPIFDGLPVGFTTRADLALKVPDALLARIGKHELYRAAERRFGRVVTRQGKRGFKVA